MESTRLDVQIFYGKVTGYDSVSKCRCDRLPISDGSLLITAKLTGHG
ncbi:MAG: hypothetical protein AAFP07_01800 [Cyanobacteria bacterium J06606_4]